MMMTPAPLAILRPAIGLKPRIGVHRTFLGVLLAFMGAAGVIAADQQDLSGVSAPAQRLRIDAVASDRDGNPVTSLKPEELEVWIGGYRVPIQMLSSVTPETDEHPARLIVLLLDDITLEPPMVARAREVAQRFVSRMLPGDRLSVSLLSGGSVELISDPSKVRGRIDGFRQSLGVIPTDRLGEHVLTTIGSVARAMVEAPERRKAIVAIGSGWLLDTPVPPAEIYRDLREEWFSALRGLAIGDTTYYVIDPLGVGASRQMGSSGFAREAGGHAFLNTNDLSGPVDRVLRESSHYYTIVVGDPPVGRKAAMRELELRVLRRGVTVRSRRSIPGTEYSPASR